MKRLLLGLAVVFSLTGCGSSEESLASSGESDTLEAEQMDEQRKQELEKAVYDITQKGYPKMYKAWGKEWIDSINSMQFPAVMLADKQEKCDIPEMIGVSDKKSTPKENVVFFIDCKNGERFYIDQKQIEEGGDVSAQSEILAEPHKYISACADHIKEKLNYPNSFDQEILSTSSRKTQTGNIEIILPFTTKNAFGAEMKNTGKCIITTDKKIEVTIFDK